MMRWNSTKTYTEEDMLRMQQEAVNRVHEFQARAQVPSFYGEETPIGELPAAPPVIEAQSRVVEEPEPPASAPTEQPQPQPQQAQQPFPQQNPADAEPDASTGPDQGPARPVQPGQRNPFNYGSDVCPL